MLEAGFRNPRVFQRWPTPRRARVQGSRDVQRALYKKWDQVHSLHLIPASDSERPFRCGLFSVYKNDRVDRQILNPLPENSRSFTVSDATLSLAHSSLLCQLYIPPGKNFVINSDDLKDFYHALQVRDSHASRNHIHGVFKGSQFEGSNAFRPELRDPEVIGCFRTLARRAGCLSSHDQVAYKHPIPRGPGYESLCIDDHVYLLPVPCSDFGKPASPNRRDAQLFDQAQIQYLKVGCALLLLKLSRMPTLQ